MGWSHFPGPRPSSGYVGTSHEIEMFLRDHNFFNVPHKRGFSIRRRPTFDSSAPPHHPICLTDGLTSQGVTLLRARQAKPSNTPNWPHLPFSVFHAFNIFSPSPSPSPSDLVVVKRGPAQNLLEGSPKHSFLGPASIASDSLAVGWGWRLYSPLTFPGTAAAVGPRTAL